MSETQKSAIFVRESHFVMVGVMFKLFHRLEREVADVYEVAGDGGGGGHYGADEVGAAVAALAALEVAVAGAGAAFVGGQDVGIHADAHAATGVAPLETGGGENFVEAFFFGLGLDAAGAGDDQGLFDG